MARNIWPLVGVLSVISFLLPFILVAEFTAAEDSFEEFKRTAIQCTKSRDLLCAEKMWAEYVTLRPADANAIANLGIILNKRGKHKAAIANFERAIDLGEGTYDLFAFYADSLADTGKIDEAIDWSYKSLSVVPTLVDVRGDLAKLLVSRNRHHEALALLAAYDGQLEDKGKKPFFSAQRIAIETGLERNRPPAEAATLELRLPKLGEHFYAPVKCGESRSSAFMIDTGASDTFVSESFLSNSKVPYEALDQTVSVKLADGRVIKGRRVKFREMRIGPFEISHVRAVACENCTHLLGQTTLTQFDLKSSKAQGVEFLTLTQRPR
jgi:tetratricopeptide (TPR) repeat protein